MVLCFRWVFKQLSLLLSRPFSFTEKTHWLIAARVPLKPAVRLLDRWVHGWVCGFSGSDSSRQWMLSSLVFDNILPENFYKARILEALSWKEPLDSSIPSLGLVQESSLQLPRLTLSKVHEHNSASTDWSGFSTSQPPCLSFVHFYDSLDRAKGKRLLFVGRQILVKMEIIPVGRNQ